MAPPEPADVWMQRARDVVEIANKMSGPTVVLLVLGLFVGFLTGYIKFTPLDKISTDLKTHDERGDVQTDILTTMAATLKNMDVTLKRSDKRMQLIDCARLTDPDLRKRCLSD